MSEIEKHYNGETIVNFEEETELEKNYNKVAELYSKAVKKKIEYHKEIERLNNIINEIYRELEDKQVRIMNGESFEDVDLVIDLKSKIRKLKGSDK